jgi:hypothetical protein
MNLPVLLQRTKLGGNIGGKFDFYFDGRRVLITVPVRFQFETGISAEATAQFKAKYNNAIKKFWTDCGYGLHVQGKYSVSFIPVHITSPELQNGAYFIIDVKAKPMRANLRFDMNVFIGEPERTIAHEFGHCLGLYDEYYITGSWWKRIENLSPTFRHEFRNDKMALMNIGTEIRPRYFEHICKKAQQYMPSGVKLLVAKAPETKA